MVRAIEKWVDLKKENERWVGSRELGCSGNTTVRKGGVVGRKAPEDVHALTPEPVHKVPWRKGLYSFNWSYRPYNTEIILDYPGGLI